MPPPNISSLIADRARELPGSPAIIGGGGAVTFAELEADVALLAAGLRAAGVKSGARAALLITPSADFVALTFALYRAGAITVLIDPGIGLPAMKRCLEEAAPEAFAGVTKAHVARLLFGWAPSSKLNITAGRKLLWGGLTLDALRELGRAAGDGIGDTKPHGVPDIPETASINFTSGSTGAPKGAVYTHAMLHAQAAMLKEYFGITPGFTSVPTFPLFALFDVALGLTIVIPEMDFARPAAADPAMLCRLMNQHGAAQLFGSPALIDNLGRYGERTGTKLPSLERVISCGAPVRQAVIDRVSKMLRPGVPVHTPYGATEALPVACISGEELSALGPGFGVCVGKPWPGVEVSVIRIDDGPIEDWSPELAVKDGEVGEITVKGPIVSPRYFNRPEGDALAKIKCPGGGIYHRMGDAGWRDAEGRLWFCGRKSHRVVTAEATLFTIPCESVFNAHPGVRRTALVGVGPAGAKRPVICVEPEPGKKPGPGLTEELLALGAGEPHTKNIRDILYHPGFPVDVRHNAKIGREKLAAWAAGRLKP
ncbi:MAG: peptide synthase [Elusimicrobia bacterium]|nr:MAG: peptide synthase [Elusimicrobiota bacterium]KAF0154177.1 MAG: peptide synthase [Elusimicrobiota bacterium]